MICTLIAFCPEESLRAADQCTSTFGLLDMTHLMQATSVWCFVTSTKEVLDRLQVEDPLSMNIPPFYSSCRLYNLTNNPGIDCCQVDPTATSQCLSVGWPDDVFNNVMPYTTLADPGYTSGGALSWSDLKGQICPSGSRGQPFIYLAEPITGGIPHTYTAIGFQENVTGTGQNVIYVHSHETIGMGPSGAGIVDELCYRSGACPPFQYRHDGDVYNIHLPAIPNGVTGPPAAPKGLTVR